MTIRPDYDGPEYGQEMWEAEPPPKELEDEGERELTEAEEEEEELEYLDPEGNELHVRGQVCERCGTVIAATQDARLLPDGHWIHEACPVRPS